MYAFRFARAAVRARPASMRVAIQRRGYAEAVPDKVRRYWQQGFQKTYR